MTKHVLAVHHIALASRKARVTPPSTFKRARPLSSSDNETTDAPTNEPLANVHWQTTVTQYSPISDADYPYSPVPLPIVVIHLDTDDSDNQEHFVPTLSTVRTVTAITSPSSPIFLLDKETSPSLTTRLNPMKKFRVTLETPLICEDKHTHGHVNTR